jgi:hypothetical protein
MDSGAQTEAVLRQRLIQAAADLLVVTGNRPFSANIVDGEPLVVVTGPRDEVAALLGRVLASHED